MNRPFTFRTEGMVGEIEPMCSYCKGVMDLLQPGGKGSRRINPLARLVPWRLQEADRYFDMDLNMTVHVMQCNHCGEIYRIPHTKNREQMLGWPKRKAPSLS